MIGGIALLILLCWNAGADEPTASKDEVKAAFLFNFAKFVEWPDGASASNAPIRIGVLGRNDSFSSTLERIISGKQIDGRPVVLESYDDLPQAHPHILFVSPLEKRILRRALANAVGSSVLTVSEIEGFCEAGGMINFRLEGRKMRFEINPKAAERQKLKLSSKLLGVALRLVETEAEQ